MEDIFKILKDRGFVGDDGILTTNEKPFNVFARLANGTMENKVDQSPLGEYRDEFMICHNVEKNDVGWNDVDCVSGSMAGPDENGPGHVFITTKNLHWKYFNIKSIIHFKEWEFLDRLHKAAIKYCQFRKWKNVELFFHEFPDNSVNSLHLHILNKDNLGVHYHKHEHRSKHMEEIKNNNTL